jgi:hypothetical protein
MGPVGCETNLTQIIAPFYEIRFENLVSILNNILL